MKKHYVILAIIGLLLNIIFGLTACKGKETTKIETEKEGTTIFELHTNIEVNEKEKVEIEDTKQSEEKHTEIIETKTLDTSSKESNDIITSTEHDEKIIPIEQETVAQVAHENYEQATDSLTYTKESESVGNKRETSVANQTTVSDLLHEEETTVKPSDNVTVNVKINKAVNGVKTYVKTLTYIDKPYSYMYLPMTLSEDPRCKLGSVGYDEFGYQIWNDNYYVQGFEESYRTPILDGEIEGEQFKCKIETSGTYEITYVYQEIDVNIYKQTEDLKITYVDTYTFKGVPGDKFAIPYYLPSDNNFVINDFIALSDDCVRHINYEQDGNNAIFEFGFYETSLDEYVDNWNVSYYYEDVSNKIISEIILTDMSEYEKVKAIHDWLVINVDYDYAFNEISFWAEGPIICHIGVCSGFADAFNRLAGIAGVKSMYISGETTDGVGHAWNLVMVDGVWYHIDCTFDEGLSYGTNIEYTYFLKSDNYMRSDRTFSSEIKCDYDY